MKNLTQCNQAGCEQPAAFRFTWPGRDEAGICTEHERKMRGVAAAMGLYVQTIPIHSPSPEPGGPR